MNEDYIVNGNIYIVMFIEWHTYVGRCHLMRDDAGNVAFVRVTHPKAIKDWGVSKGLGELYKGPLSGTVLDLSGEMRIPVNPSLISLMEVDQKAWAKHIAKSEHGGD